MDEKVLKCVTVLMGVLTIVVCVSLNFFPQLHAKAVAYVQEKEEENSTERVITQRRDPATVVEADAGISAQLKIELPKQLTMNDLTIENDYVKQTVYIRFPDGVDDYFQEYSIRGSSDHIADLSYYKQNGQGVIMLGLDRVYELQNKMEAGNLYIDFLSPHDVYDKVVVIDAGHGGDAAGAVKKGYCEKDVDLAIVQKLKEILDADTENIGVYYTRLDDSNPSLDARVQMANKADADLFISVHNNSTASGRMSSLNGTQVLYSESDDSELSSERLAHICLDNVVAQCGSRSIGLLPGDEIYIIRTSDVPVALIEVGFMTNSSELQKLNSDEYQIQAAQGIYQAMKQAFQEGY